MRLIVVFLFLFGVNSISGQSLKVVKILDSNLFELEDGRIVKLAGVDSPQLNNPIPLFAETAKYAVSYNKEVLLKRKVLVETISKVDSKNYELVYLWLKYPLEDLDLNQKFLEKGFGKFIYNVDPGKKAVLIEAEKYAADKYNGIWKYYKPGVYDTLDEDLRGINTSQLILIDSTRFQKYSGPRSIYSSIPLELLAGSGMTAVFGYLGFLGGIGISALTNPNDRWSILGIGVLSGLAGYIIAFPSGVYMVAKDDNPNLSWLATVGTGVGLSLLTTCVSLIIYKDDGTNSWAWWVAGLSPIIGSLLYVHVFPPAPPTKEELIKQNFGHQKINSFKDYYDATMNFRMELIRIYF